jgi:hypothetical protein
VVKLSAATALDCSVVVVADSDVALLQRLEVYSVLRDGVVRFYRKPAGVDRAMRQHRRWHATAEELLGVKADESRRDVDYISPFLAWNPLLVNTLRTTVESAARGDWRTAMASQAAFSECILYGRYVDEVADPPSRTWWSDDDLCQTYWDTQPLSDVSFEHLLAGLSSATLALHIQSTSATTLAVRQQAIAEAERRVRAGHRG